MKRPDGITIIAIYHFVMLALCVFGLCGLVVGLLLMIADKPPDVLVGVFWMVFSMAFVFLFAVAHGVIGWGLLNMKEWARWGSIVIAVISLLGFPIFTVIGAVILWYLLKPEIKEAFASEAPKEAEKIDEGESPPLEESSLD